MRMALVVNRFPTVSETFLSSKAAYLAEAGVELTVVTHRESGAGDAAHFPGVVIQKAPAFSAPMSAGRVLFRRAFAQPARTVRFASSVLTGGADDAASAWLRASPLVTGDFDIIHFAFSGIAVAYLPAFEQLRSSSIFVSCRGAAEQIRPLADPQRSRELRAVFNAADRIHCVSDDMAQTVARLGASRDRLFVNRPAIDTAGFQRSAPYRPAKGRFRMLSVGRLHWKKGLDDGLLALRTLVANGLDVEYRILGEGVEREHLTFIAHEQGLADRVHLLGAGDPGTVRAELEACHALLLPSLSEGISNVVLEAMAMEVPVVSTTAGGMAEALTDGVEGFLVEPHDHVQMAQRIQRLIDTPTLGETMGKEARKRALREFDLDRQKQVFLDEYERALGSLRLASRASAWRASAKRAVRRSIRRARASYLSVGDHVSCPLCEWSGREFLPAGRPSQRNRQCPRCGSLERYRALALICARELQENSRPLRMLEVAPHPSFRSFCEQFSHVRYLSTDLGSRRAMFFGDLTNLGVADDSFDLLVCSHVLEHIPADGLAMREIHRVLRPGGRALLMVPISGEKTEEDPGASPQERARRFGQSDHVRMYGKDFGPRLENAGLDVEVLDMFEDLENGLVNRHALRGDDRYLFIASKSGGAA